MRKSILALAIFSTVAFSGTIGLADLISQGMYGSGGTGAFYSIDPTDASQTLLGRNSDGLRGMASVTVVPTPSALLLCGIGLAVAGYRLRRRKTA